MTEVKVGANSIATYAYTADGARVKRAMGSITTYYIGNWFEVSTTDNSELNGQLRARPFDAGLSVVIPAAHERRHPPYRLHLHGPAR